MTTPTPAPRTRATTARIRALRTRVFRGVLPKPEALESLGLSWDDVNEMRRLAELPPVPDPGKGRSSGRIRADRPFTMEQLATAALEAIGSPLLTVSGEVKRAPSGKERTLSAGTVNCWLAAIRRTLRALDGQDDVGAALRDHARVLAHFKATSHTPASLSTRVHYISALSKYVPELGRQLGDALGAYRAAAAEARKAEREVDVERTDDPEHAVRAFPEIAAAVPRIADKFGRHSFEHLAALLHTEVVGLRDDLKGLPWYHAESDVPDGTPNYYVADSGHLRIAEFKTATFFPPYDLILRPATRQLLRESLAMRPRRYLLGKATVSRLIKRGFEGVGLPTVTGVTAIRHSRITHEIRKNPSPANVRKVAERHKHSHEMSMSYFRQTVRGGSGGDEEEQ